MALILDSNGVLLYCLCFWGHEKNLACGASIGELILTRIIIADHSIMFRKGLISLMKSDPSIDAEVIGEAGDGLECIELLDSIRNQCDLLIINSDLPSLDGFDTLNRIRLRFPALKTIVLSKYSDYNKIVRYYDQINNSFILFDSDYSELSTAINQVIQDKTYIERSLIDYININLAKDDSLKKDDIVLTKRQIQILKFISKGYSNKEIATKLDISDRTVKNHIFMLFKKIGVVDRTQAAVYALRKGLIK